MTTKHSPTKKTPALQMLAIRNSPKAACICLLFLNRSKCFLSSSFVFFFCSRETDLKVTRASIYLSSFEQSSTCRASAVKNKRTEWPPPVIYVVVQFNPWFNFDLLLFSMLIYDNEFKTKENQNCTKDKIELQHIHTQLTDNNVYF